MSDNTPWSLSLPAGAFAQQIAFQDVPVQMFQRRLNIAAGLKVLAESRGDSQTFLGSGTVTIQSLADRLRVWDPRNGSITVVRGEDVHLPFLQERIRNVEHLSCRVEFIFIVKIRDLLLFRNNTLGSRSMYAIDELEQLVRPWIADAVRRVFESHTVDRLAAADIQSHLEKAILEVTQPSLERAGLRFVATSDVRFSQHEFDVWRDRESRLVMGQRMETQDDAFETHRRSAASRKDDADRFDAELEDKKNDDRVRRNARELDRQLETANQNNLAAEANHRHDIRQADRDANLDAVQATHAISQRILVLKGDIKFDEISHEAKIAQRHRQTAADIATERMTTDAKIETELKVRLAANEGALQDAEFKHEEQLICGKTEVEKATTDATVQGLRDRTWETSIRSKLEIYDLSEKMDIDNERARQRQRDESSDNEARRTSDLAERLEGKDLRLVMAVLNGPGAERLKDVLLSQDAKRND